MASSYFPTFTPQRPNADIWRFNAGNSILRGMKTIADIDLERAAEQRLRDAAEVEKRVKLSLLPVQMDLQKSQTLQNLAMADYYAAGGAQAARIASDAANDLKREEFLRNNPMLIPAPISEQLEGEEAGGGMGLGGGGAVFELGPEPEENFFDGLDNPLNSQNTSSGDIFDNMPEASPTSQSLPLMPVAGAEGPGAGKPLPESQGEMNLEQPAPQLSVSKPEMEMTLGGMRKKNALMSSAQDPEEAAAKVFSDLGTGQALKWAPDRKTGSMIYSEYLSRRKIADQVAATSARDKNNPLLGVVNSVWSQSSLQDVQDVDRIFRRQFGMSLSEAEAIVNKFGGMPDAIDKAVYIRRNGSPKYGVPAGADWHTISEVLGVEVARINKNKDADADPDFSKDITAANSVFAAAEKTEDPDERQNLLIYGQSLLDRSVPPDIRPRLISGRQQSLINMTQFLSQPNVNYKGEPMESAEEKIDAGTKIQQRAGIDYPVVSAELLPDGQVKYDDNAISEINKWYSDNKLAVPEGMIPLMGLRIKTNNGIKVYPVQGGIGKDKTGNPLLETRSAYMELPIPGPNSKDGSSAQKTDAVASIESKIEAASEEQKLGSTKFTRERDARRAEVKKLEDAEDSAMDELQRAYELIRNPKLNKSDFRTIANRIKEIRLSQGDDPETIDAYIREVTPWSWREDETAKELNKWWGYEP